MMLSSSSSKESPSENTALLLLSHRGTPKNYKEDNEDESWNAHQYHTAKLQMVIVVMLPIAMLLLLLIMISSIGSNEQPSLQPSLQHLSSFPPEETTMDMKQFSHDNNKDDLLSLSSSFPSQFVWGTATSSYQIEGGIESRGASIWDVFCHDGDHIWNHSNADVACDHYHRYQQDIQLLHELEIPHYRFSISWPRILPNGATRLGRGIDAEGIAFYNHLIDTLLAYNITPWITLYHWDLPLALEDDYGGWLGRETVDAFGDYARICFQAFGDRVKHWITINEAWSLAVLGYNNGVHAPGHTSHPTTEPYVVGHHLLLAHATAAHIYQTEFRQQHGRIGMSNCGDFRYPQNASNIHDQEAAQRAMLFQMGWFTDPLIYGDYPNEMRRILGDRLPKFTRAERQLLTMTTKHHPETFMIGLNHYSSLLAAAPPKSKYPPTFGGYWADIDVDFSNHPTWSQTSMGWNVVPQGCRDMLLWISKRYPNITIYITESGISDDDDSQDTTKKNASFASVIPNDAKRISYLQGYIHAVKQALELGVSVGGYFVWSLMDNFEWQYGYQRKFGIVQVNFDKTLDRTPKQSALWYRSVIQRNRNNEKG